jgi:hypothetical protein
MARTRSRVWSAGDRVRIVGTPTGLQLTMPSGTVVGPDPDWGGYYIVRLDQPAIYYCRGHDEPLTEITEAGDNLQRLADGSV